MQFIEEQRKAEETKEVASKQQPQMSPEETQKFVNEILAKQRYA
jgi:hypothetical protein